MTHKVSPFMERALTKPSGRNYFLFRPDYSFYKTERSVNAMEPEPTTQTSFVLN